MIVSMLLSCLAVFPAGDEPIVRGEIAAGIDDYLSRLEAFGFAGVALYADSDGVALAKGYGVADREQARPVTTDTVFSTGSITKQFTGAAILLLQERGELSVDDPIELYFDDVPPDKAGITLHHLLTHSSGLRSDFADSDHDPVGREEYVRRALASQLLSAPGDEFHYANSGFSLLAAIVEQLSDQSYERFLRTELFEPAGMLDTGYVLPDYGDRLAIGYRSGERWGTVLGRPMGEDGPYWALRGNGGVHSTIGDMYRWHQALAGDELLSAESKEELYGRHIAEGPGAGSYYGYGWSIEPTPRYLVTHNGGNGIFAADYLRYLNDDVVLFIASNNADAGAIGTTPTLRRLAFGERASLPPKVVPLPADQLERYAGTYVLPSQAEIRIEPDGNGLRAYCANAEAFEHLLTTRGFGATRHASFGARSKELITAAGRGDYSAVVNAVAPGFPGDLEERETATWTTLTDQLGPLEEVEYLGADPLPYGARVHLRLGFARGARFVQHAWDDGVDALVGLMVDELPPARTFRPLSSTSFASYDIRHGQSNGLTFVLDAEGAPAGISLRTMSGPVTATKR
ncbi:MAG: serine hydrolase [Planctomycetota bacterium]